MAELFECRWCLQKKNERPREICEECGEKYIQDLMEVAKGWIQLLQEIPRCSD